MAVIPAIFAVVMAALCIKTATMGYRIACSSNDKNQ